MNRGSPELKIAFETSSLRIPLTQIDPLREVSERVKKSVKYGQIAASIKEVGIIEPPVVVRDPSDPEKFHLLDGHLRVEISREQGISAIVCLVATDDEAFTYNKRVNRRASIQEQKMIMTAIDMVNRKGAGLDERTIREQLDGNICRCTGYHNIVKAVAQGAREMAAPMAAE